MSLCRVLVVAGLPLVALCDVMVTGRAAPWLAAYAFVMAVLLISLGLQRLRWWREQQRQAGWDEGFREGQDTRRKLRPRGGSR